MQMRSEVGFVIRFVDYRINEFFCGGVNCFFAEDCHQQFLFGADAFARVSGIEECDQSATEKSVDTVNLDHSKLHVRKSRVVADVAAGNPGVAEVFAGEFIAWLFPVVHASETGSLLMETGNERQDEANRGDSIEDAYQPVALFPISTQARPSVPQSPRR